MKRPWNLTDSSVYSLATCDGDRFNMNICTYVTAVSRKPKMYAVAIDLLSKTQTLLKNTDFAVLQVLGKSHTSLIRPLGQKSGYKYDKQSYLIERELVVYWNGQSVLKDAAAYVSLARRGSQVTGDHELYWFEALKSKTNHKDLLRFQDLVDEGLIL